MDIRLLLVSRIRPDIRKIKSGIGQDTGYKKGRLFVLITIFLVKYQIKLETSLNNFNNLQTLTKHDLVTKLIFVLFFSCIIESKPK
jgi:hypothetical protein